MGRYLETSRQALEDLRSLSAKSRQSNDRVAHAVEVETIVDLIFDASDQRVRGEAMRALIAESDANVASVAFDSGLLEIGRRFGIGESEMAKTVARSWIAGIHGEWIAETLSENVKQELHKLDENRRSQKWS